MSRREQENGIIASRGLVDPRVTGYDRGWWTSLSEANQAYRDWHLEQARRRLHSGRPEGASKDPENASSAIPIRGVTPKPHVLGLLAGVVVFASRTVLG